MVTLVSCFLAVDPALWSRMAIRLDQIVPWGRSCREYELMFDLAPEDLSSTILDCGGGPSSFTAEMTARGHRVVSVDPIYSYSGAEIRARFDATIDTILAQVRATPDDWVWGCHRNPDDLRANRCVVMEKFLLDYEAGLREQRYARGELSVLPFPSNAFGLALCSHLLFLYSELLSAEFHVRSVLELCRVAREVRLFPLLSHGGELSPHIVPVQTALASAGWHSEIRPVRYEFQRGGNQMLRVFKP
jgi:SAM-dependent methyltransferase